MGKVIAKTKVKREKGFLYFLDKKGNVAKVAMKRAGKKANKKQTVVAKCGVQAAVAVETHHYEVPPRVAG